jgi:hypothetical protein
MRMRSWAAAAVAVHLQETVTAISFPYFSPNQIFGLYPRASAQCGNDATLNPCGNGRPVGWCCPLTTNCLSISNAGTDTVICCPQGSDCTTIQTISCDMSFQDAGKYPTSSVHTANLTLGLPACGSQCCPLGYGCGTNASGAPTCRLLPTSRTSNSSFVSSTTAGPSGTLTSTLNPTSTRPIANGTTKGTQSLSSGTVAAIVVPILLVFFAVAGVLIWCSTRKSKRKKISAPIYDPQRSARTDFVNRYHARARHTGGTPRSPEQHAASSSSRPETSGSQSALVSGGAATGIPPRHVERTQSSPGPAGSNVPPPAQQGYYSARVLPSVPGRSSPAGISTGPGPGQGYTLPRSTFSP